MEKTRFEAAPGTTDMSDFEASINTVPSPLGIGKQAVESVAQDTGSAEKTRTDELYEEGAQAWETWDPCGNRPA